MQKIADRLKVISVLHNHNIICDFSKDFSEDVKIFN